jgi:hypothetical protein
MLNRWALGGLVGLVVTSVAASPSPARAGGPASVVVVDITGNPADDAKLRIVTEDTVRQLGNTVHPAEPFEKALATPGSPGFSRDPAALDYARASAKLWTLVRVYAAADAAMSAASSTGRRRRELPCEVLIFDNQGVHRSAGVLPAKDRAAALVRLIKQAWQTPAAPLSSLSPAAGTPAAAPALAETTAAAPALAETMAAAPMLAVSAAAAPAVDSVALVDGTALTGTIVEQKPGQYVIIQAGNGSQSTVPWSQVKQVTVAPRNVSSTQAAASTSAPATVTPSSSSATAATGAQIVNREKAGVDVYKGTATYSQQKGCPPGSPPEKCQEQLNAGFDATTRDATVSQTKNCADGTTGGSCTEQVQAQAGLTSGLKVGYTKEEVTAVTTRPSSSTDFGLGAGFQFGTGQDLTLLGFSGDLTIDRIMGSRLPGKEGGSWSGLFLEPKASVQFMNILAEGMTGQMFGFAAGGTAGWQYFKFQGMADDTLHQSGWGFRAGGYAGYTWFQSKIDVMGMSFESSSDQTSYGPSLGFTKLTYNPGTADVRRTDVNVFVLPTGDFTFFLVQANKSW